MKKISASYIFRGKGPPLKNGILICSDDGTILEVTDTGSNLREMPSPEYYNGILMPGFINAHCHIELSHLKGKIREKTGISNFIGEINRLRDEDRETTEKEIEKADNHLFSMGTAATGDISNSIISLKTKLNSNIYFIFYIWLFI